MAIVKQPAGVLLAILVLSQSALAMRMQSKQQVQVDNEQREADFETAKWCWFSRSKKLKDYYFEVKLPEMEEHSTMKLVRDPEWPKLIVDHNHRWIVRAPPAEGESDPNGDLEWEDDIEHPKEMQWLSQCFGCSEGDKTVIELRNATSIKKVHVSVTDPRSGEVEEEVGLEITNADGTVESFIGGVYLPRKLMYDAMIRALEENSKFNGLANEARESSSATDNMKEGAWKRFTKGFKGTVKSTVGTGAVAGGSVGVGFGATVLLMGIPGLSGAVVTTMLAGAGAGLVAGTTAGLALGAVFGSVVGGAYGLWDYHKQKKELLLAGTEKIWDKLECHSWFKHCSSDLIVPYYNECPAE